MFFFFFFFFFFWYPNLVAELALASGLSSGSFSASSSRLGNEPDQGRLNEAGAWSPSNNNDADGYLEVNLEDAFFISAVATQGNPQSNEWTTSYKLHILKKVWIIYKENNTEKVCKNHT